MTLCKIKMGLWKLSLRTRLIKYEIVQYLLCISRNPAVEEERLVVSEQIFLENLRDDQSLLQMASLAVQVVGGEAGEVLGVVRHSGDATQNSLHQTLLCLGKIYRKILSLTVCRAVDWPGRSATPSWSAGSSSVTITGSWGTRTLVLVSKRQERRRWCRQYNCQTIVLYWQGGTGTLEEQKEIEVRHKNEMFLFFSRCLAELQFYQLEIFRPQPAVALLQSPRVMTALKEFQFFPPESLQKSKQFNVRMVYVGKGEVVSGYPSSSRLKHSLCRKKFERIAPRTSFQLQYWIYSF